MSSVMAMPSAPAAKGDSQAEHSIAACFDREPDRLQRMSGEIAGIYFDFSKARASAADLESLLERAAASDFAGWRLRLFAGEIVNPSEGRAATHPAERGCGSVAIVAAAAAERRQARNLIEAIGRGRFGPVSHVLHIGIGGSALGPALLIDALGREAAIDVAVVSNVDGASLEPVLKRFNPHKTLVLIASKTFTTVETLTNAQSALAWLTAGGVDDPKSRCIALTAAPDRAQAFGIAEDRILGFAETVGGRYSLWSVLGLPAAIALGNDAFDQLLAGAADMDRHFLAADGSANLPLLAALIDIHHAELGAQTVGVFAYDDRLTLLPSYLQQLQMESNGKGVGRDGGPIPGPTGSVIWGGVGTDAQHAVFQLLHQGTHLIPVEFLAVREPGHSLGGSHHRQLLSNCFAQGAALMRGRTFDEALALASGDAALAAAKTFPGNRPSSTILLDRLDPYSLGALLAFYEHRTFAAATVLGINPFDQWGVELGKEMAKAVDSGTVQGFDASTSRLLARAGL